MSQQPNKPLIGALNNYLNILASKPMPPLWVLPSGKTNLKPHEKRRTKRPIFLQDPGRKSFKEKAITVEVFYGINL